MTKSIMGSPSTSRIRHKVVRSSEDFLERNSAIITKIRQAKEELTRHQDGADTGRGTADGGRQSEMEENDQKDISAVPMLNLDYRAEEKAVTIQIHASVKACSFYLVLTL